MNLSYEFNLVTDDNIPFPIKTQIEQHIGYFFPENLIQGVYHFGKKLRNPKRLICINNNELIAHLLFVERNIIVQNELLKCLYVGELFVTPKFQKKGIGRELLKNYDQFVTAEKTAFSILICESYNTGFYQNCGWEKLNGINVFLGITADTSRLAEGSIMARIYSQSAKKLLNKGHTLFLGDSV